MQNFYKYSLTYYLLDDELDENNQTKKIKCRGIVAAKDYSEAMKQLIITYGEDEIAEVMIDYFLGGCVLEMKEEYFKSLDEGVESF